MPHGVIRSYLFADLREYTVFVETQGDAAAVRLLRAYRALVRAEVVSRKGAEIKTEGDSFYVVFRTPGDAVRCAMGIVRRALTHNKRHADLALRIGIGINSGEAVELGRGYVGSAVILAARLAQQAEGGRILVTDTVRALLRILEDKGHVRHEQDGPRYVYLPTIARDNAQRSALRHILQTFFDGSAEQAISALLDDGSARFSPAELDRLARMIDTARKSGA